MVSAVFHSPLDTTPVPLTAKKARNNRRAHRIGAQDDGRDG